MRLGIVFVFCAATAFAAAEPKRVLIVHSFGSVAPPFTTHSTAFEAELVKQLGNHVDLDEVSLDMARYAEPDMQEALVDYLEKRGDKWKPDLVVPIGGPAGIFVAKFRNRLFREIPILYCALDQRLLGPEAFDANTAFIGANYEVKGFAEDILQIAPDTKNIVVVIGATPLEQFWAKAFQKEFEPFTDRVNFIWLNDLPFDQMLERVKKLPPHSFIFFILFLRDAAGVTQNADEALQRLHAVANAPINSIFTSQMGLGIVGGHLYPSTEDGVKGAETAVRILNGEPPSSFSPSIVPPSSPRYDWRELKRWNINEHRLPAGSTVLFREPTVWQRYQAWIIAGVSIFTLQALLITGLLLNLFRRRRAESSLTESERRFETMADAAPIMIWMTGEDKLCTFVNKAWLAFTGRRMEQELGNGWSEVVHHDDFENAIKTYVAAFDARSPFAMKYRIRRHDGEYRFITDSGAPRFGPYGRFRGYVGACVDVTDLLEKQKALSEVEERVALATEAAHLGVWERDLANNNFWISDKARELFQFDPSEPVTYTQFRERAHPEDLISSDLARNRAIETKSGYELEYRVLLPDGTVRWISGRARCILDENGNVARLLGVLMDVTERKQAQELFQLATEASTSGTLLVDGQGHILLVNAQTEKLFNYWREELIGKRAEILVPEGFANYFANRAKFVATPHALSSGTGKQLFGRRKDGSEFPAEISLNSIRTPQGILVLASVVDITARKIAEEQERKTRDEINRLSRISLLGEMTASIAHELNQPLSGIMSNASAGQRFIDRGNVDLINIREILVDIAADSRRAHEVIAHVRNTIKKGAQMRERINMNEIITRVSHMVQPDIAAHSCELELSLEKNLPTVEGDPIQIQQVLINLVTNACDAMRTTPAGQRKVNIATELNGDETIRVNVRDYGAGITDDVRERLFDQFFTTKEEGLGMGLFIVRSIIESHGGKIDVQAKDGGGTCFCFTLPAAMETGK